jgi:hypothetical protein
MTRIIMEPQIINFYKFKNIQCTICSKRGHLSNKCPNLGSARFYNPIKEEKKDDDQLIFPIVKNEKKKKRGRKPRKNKIDDEFKFSDDEVITNFQNNPGQGPHPDSGSDTALGTSFNTQGKSNGSDEEVHFECN